MAEIVGSLFGVTPESLQMQREKQAQQEALAYAQLADPFARANYQIYQGASGLGREIGGLLGAQDPELAKATALQGILKNADTTSAEGYNSLARTLAQQGFGAQATQAAQQALAMREKESIITKNLREKEGADPFQQFLRASVGKVTPESLAAYKQSGNVADLDWIEKPNQPDIAKLQAYRSTLPQGSPERAEVDAVIKAAAEGKGTKVYNTIEGLDKAITAVTGKSVGEEISKLGQSVSGLSKFERAVSDVETLLPNSFTGLGAGTLTQLNKAAAAVGASKGEKASNTEILTNTFNNIVLPMARQLPGSLAAKELSFLLTTKPATEQEPATIRRLMKQMLQDYRADKTAYEASQKYQSANKGSYAGFDINAARYNAGRIADLTQRVKDGTASLDEAQELKKLRSAQ
jgi:hypothetical protein